MKNFRINISMTKFILLYSVYFGFVLNIPIISRLMDITADSNLGLFVYSAPRLLTCAFVVIFSLLALPYIAKPLFILVVTSSAAACYATLQYGVLFDYGMIENLVETNSGEVISYINFSSMLYLFFAGIVPAILIALVRFNTQEPLLTRILKRIVLVVVAIVISLLITVCFYKDYVSVGRNNSYLNKMIVPAHIFNTFKYLKNKFFTEKLAYKRQGEDAVLSPAKNNKPALMVLIVGETARSMNIGYNGYARNTNPYTQDMDIISFQNVSSCGTATAHSLPCMFSNLNRSNYNKNRANSQDDVLDVLKHANVDVLWKDDDGGDKSVAKGVKLITIDANKSDIENCTDKEIINVYDNTIAYTDYVIAETIKKLQGYSKDYNVALLYMSDHGESLGEKGLYLHGTPYAFAPEEQTQVPLFMWLPQQYADAKGIDKGCLIEKAKQGTFSHDNLFHTLLGLYGVKSSVINPRLDITASCRL